MLLRNPSRHLPKSSAVRLGASTLAYGCSFPRRVDTVDALLRLLLHLRTIRDLHKELQRLLEETIDSRGRWPIDYDHCIHELDAGRSTTTTASTSSTLNDRLRPLYRCALRWTMPLQLFFHCSTRLVVLICDHLLAWLPGLRVEFFELLLS